MTAAHQSTYRGKYPERVRNSKQKWAANNPEKVNAHQRTYWAERKEKKAAHQKRWREKNPDSRQASNATRRKRIGKATPPWANRFFIVEAYRLARLRALVTGFQWDVDHCIPLHSQNVCGLHVETNLRVCPAIINRSKSNKFEGGTASWEAS